LKHRLVDRIWWIAELVEASFSGQNLMNCRIGWDIV